MTSDASTPSPERTDFDRFLAGASESAQEGRPMSISIRSLIGFVGAERRGTRVLRQVQAALDRHGLVADPSFVSGWVDTTVQLRKSESGTAKNADSESQQSAIENEEVALTVRNLESATHGVMSVDRNSDLLRARALMLRHDYSQLAVMSGPRQLVGAISWESMALASIRAPEYSLGDATIRAQTVGLDDDLVALIPTIAERGFVFVAARDRTLGGIVTTADLSLQFATLAGPFLMIGEIERRLRQTLANHFQVSDLAKVRDPADSTRTIESVNDLTLGETLRIIENPSNWSRLGWPVDRTVFVDALNEVKAIRNEVMHFSPDPLTRSQQTTLENFMGWLRAMEPSR